MKSNRVFGKLFGRTNLFSGCQKKLSLILGIVMLMTFTPFGVIGGIEEAEATTLEESFAFESSDYMQFGKYEDEPILWRVVHVDNEEGPLLVSEYILFTRAFDTSNSKVWNRPATLKVYLNDDGEGGEGFLSTTNFSDREKELLKHIISAPSSDNVAINAKIFILSRNEINNYIGNTNADRIAHKRDSTSSPYWTRTPAPESNFPASVIPIGSGGQVGSFYSDANNPTGVRPALYLNQPSINSISGLGTKADPYVLNAPPPAMIDIAEIPGITAPETGGTPVTTVTETDQFTGVVTWDPDHDPFEAGTVYTATITLTAKAGFTLDGVDEDFFTVAGADTATNVADAGVVTAVFPQTVATVESYFTFNEHTGTITDYSNEGPKDVVIPDRIGGVDVTSIGDEVFLNKDLTSVIIPNSVTSIGMHAFGNNDLTSIDIPDSVTSIGIYAFQNNRLASVTIGNGVETIERGVFMGNWQLASLTIGNNVTTIGQEAFRGNGELESVSIPDSVISIEQDAFRSNGLTSVIIGNSVVSIGQNAFMYNNLTSVTIPDSVISIMNFAFSHNNLTSVNIGNSVTSIGSSAFANNNLTSVTIPDSVTSIGGSAFRNNELTSVTIGENVDINDHQDTMGNNRGFQDFYLSNNSAAGTYEYINDQWSMAVEPDSINISDIMGVSVPVTGGTPVTTITETDQFTGVVTWDPDHDPFEAGTVYTATITLTAKDGFTLDGIDQDFFVIAGADTATNVANAGVVTAVFPQTAATVSQGSSGGGGGTRPVPAGPVITGLDTERVIERAVVQENDTFTVTEAALAEIEQARAEDEGIFQIDLSSTQRTETIIEVPGEILDGMQGAAFSIITTLAWWELPVPILEEEEAPLAGLKLHLKPADKDTVVENLAGLETGEKSLVQGNPVSIVTPFRGLVLLTLPLTDVDVPEESDEQASFLSRLRVLALHSDGTQNILLGEITYDENDNPIAKAVYVDHFSTFSLILLPEESRWQEILLTVGEKEALVDGNVYVMDAAPAINPSTHRTLVPLRFVSEALGSQVEWLPETRQINIRDIRQGEELEMVLTIGSNQVLVNDQVVDLDSPAEIDPAADRTLVPLRFVSEALGARVSWEAKSKGITITADH